jgi:hypothetical protein
MWMVAFYNRAKSADAAFSIVRWALWGGALVLAWASSTWNWYWVTYSWAGVAFAFLASWIALALGFFLSGLGARAWRGGTLNLPTTPSEGQEAPALDDVLNRVAETERGIAQNKASLDELRTEVAMLSMSLRARDAESIIKEADQVIVFTAKKLLEGSYPDEAAWADDYAIWEKAMSRIDNLMPRWAQQHHKPFLDIRLKDFEAGAPPPQQSNIKSDTNVMRYKTVWLAQQSYANRREDILQFFASKAGELPGWKGEDF